MTIRDAHREGLIVVGQRIKTDLDDTELFPGTITCLHVSSFCVRRDDGGTGGGCNNSWTCNYDDESKFVLLDVVNSEDQAIELVRLAKKAGLL